MDGIKSKLIKALRKFVDKKKLKMDIMKNLIHKLMQELIIDLEEDPHETINMLCTADIMFGQTPEDFTDRLNQAAMKRCMLAGQGYWLDCIKQWFLDQPCVTVIGRPSSEHMTKLTKLEKRRIQTQREHLGKEGLHQKAAIMDKVAHSNQPPPSHVITAVPVPPVDTVHFHPYSIFTNINSSPEASSSDQTQFLIGDIPFQFHLCDIHTHFVQLTALLDTSSMDSSLRLYLPLYTQLLTQLPIKRDRSADCSSCLLSSSSSPDSNSNAETELENNTVSSYATIGIGHENDAFTAGDYGHLFIIGLKVEREKYEIGVHLLREIMTCLVFDKKNLKICVRKLLKEISSSIRDKEAVLNALVMHLHNAQDSNDSLMTIFRQKMFMTNVLDKLKSHPHKIVQDLKKIQKNLFTKDNLHIHMSADVEKLLSTTPDMQKLGVWVSFMPSPSLPLHKHSKYKSKSKHDRLSKRRKHKHKTHNTDEDKEDHKSHMQQQQHHSDEVIRPLSTISPHLVMGVSGVETNYLNQTTTTIKGYTHPDLPVLLVLMQYLRQCEGPLWTEIRGLGLAYEFDLFMTPDNGLLSFTLSQSTQLVQAYTKAMHSVMSFIEDRRQFNKMEFESAISSLVFELVERGKTVSDVALQTILSHYRHIDQDFQGTLLRKITTVELGQLVPAATKYLRPLFDAKLVRSAISCHPSHVKDIISQFNRLGFHYKETTESDLATNQPAV